MKTKLLVAAAFAGTLFATCLVSGSAQATTSVPVLKGDAHPGIVTLIGKKGDGGGGGHARGGGGGGGKHARGGGGGGGKHARGGGGGRYAHGGGDGGKRHYGGGGGKRYADKDHSNKDHGRKGHGDKHYAMKDRDHHDHDNVHRHRVFRNGVWVWVYGSGYAYSDECYWLRRQAIITGSPYWWDRYYACAGYDYY